VNRPCLAAITLDSMGGGVAAVSRLLWQVFQDRWPVDARLVTLLNDSGRRRSLTSSTPTRLRFGARVAALQIAQQIDWTLYTHVSIAKVQAFVPTPARRPYAVFLHGIEAWRPLSSVHTAVLQGAALRVANSGFTASRVTAMHPSIGPVVPCPLALAPDYRARAEATEVRPPEIGRRAVVMVARMSAGERYKGHDELLEVWPDVLRTVGDARLVFVGEGDDLDRLKSKAAALGIGEQVLFPGFASDSDLIGFYRQAAVFAMPSRSEGFGLVYLEAMSHGLPCIAALDDAAAEVVEDGETGYLVRQGDREALTDRLVRLLTDAPLRRQLGGAGRRRVHERFSYDRFARTMLSLIGDARGAQVPAWSEGAAL
jgi:phosphatidylinositol alpha-1,6-mannosyltransferase